VRVRVYVCVCVCTSNSYRDALNPRCDRLFLPLLLLPLFIVPLAAMPLIIIFVIRALRVGVCRHQNTSKQIDTLTCKHTEIQAL